MPSLLKVVYDPRVMIVLSNLMLELSMPSCQTQVWRVRGAGSGSPGVMRLVDPIGLWQSGAISMCLVV